MSTGFPSGSLRDERLLVDPILVVGGAQHDPDAEVDVHQVRGHELAVDDHAGVTNISLPQSSMLQ